MAEVNTFSSAVDIALARTSRLERRNDVIASVRKAIRECQTQNFFEIDLEEEILTTTGDPYIWRIPRNFRQMLAVRYPGILSPRGQAIYPVEKLPGLSQRELEHYWYQSGNTVVFKGMGSNAQIHIAYYRFLPILRYYSKGNRPAIYDVDDIDPESDGIWIYPGNDNPTPEQETELQDKVTNWLLTQYFDVIVDGATQFVLNLVRDPQASVVYAMYREGKANINQSTGQSKV